MQYLRYLLLIYFIIKNTTTTHDYVLILSQWTTTLCSNTLGWYATAQATIICQTVIPNSISSIETQNFTATHFCFGACILLMCIQISFTSYIIFLGMHLAYSSFFLHCFECVVYLCFPVTLSESDIFFSHYRYSKRLNASVLIQLEI